MRELFYEESDHSLNFILEPFEMQRFGITYKTIPSCDFDMHGLIKYLIEQCEQQGIIYDPVLFSGDQACGLEVVTDNIDLTKANFLFKLVALPIPTELPPMDVEHMSDEEIHELASDYVDALMDILQEYSQDYIDGEYEEEYEDGYGYNDVFQRKPQIGYEEFERGDYWSLHSSDLNELIRVSVKMPVLRGRSMVCKYKDEYYLIIKRAKRTEKQEAAGEYPKEDKLLRSVAELGNTEELTETKVAYLKEHGTIIIKSDAINTLRKLAG